MIYIVDHQDSFTYNLVHLLSHFDKVYVSNYSNIKFGNYLTNFSQSWYKVG